MPEKRTAGGERNDEVRRARKEKKEEGGRERARERSVDAGMARRMGYGTRHTPS